MEYFIEFLQSPWAGPAAYAAGAGSLVCVLLAVLRARRSVPLIQAWVSEVGRSGVLRIDAGQARGVSPGQLFTVYRSVAARCLQGAVLETIARRWVAIGKARVVTTGLCDALCRFWPESGMAGTAREGDFAVLGNLAALTRPPRRRRARSSAHA